MLSSVMSVSSLLPCVASFSAFCKTFISFFILIEKNHIVPCVKIHIVLFEAPSSMGIFSGLIRKIKWHPYSFNTNPTLSFFNLPRLSLALQPSYHHAVNTEHWWLAVELSQQTGAHISALGYSLRELETGLISDPQAHQEKVVTTVTKYLRYCEI